MLWIWGSPCSWGMMTGTGTLVGARVPVILCFPTETHDTTIWNSIKDPAVFSGIFFDAAEIFNLMESAAYSSQPI